MSKKVFLQKGQNPLKMEFTERQTNPLVGCLIGMSVLALGCMCSVITLIAAGVLQWPS